MTHEGDITGRPRFTFIVGTIPVVDGAAAPPEVGPSDVEP